MAMPPKKLAIVVPVYKDTLNLLEQFSIDYLLRNAPGRTIFFVAPRKINQAYYKQRYKTIGFKLFEDHFFASIKGYNYLLLDEGFYHTFSAFDYILIHQTDALLFHDDLDDWMTKGFDYIGAPWPSGVEVRMQLDRFSAGNGLNLKAYVGNGGFSLRSVQGSIGLLRECAGIKEHWLHSTSSEDLFFAFMGMISENFRVPNQVIASRFALELGAESYYAMNGEHVPTGAHAWCKHDLEFWKKVIKKVG